MKYVCGGLTRLHVSPTSFNRKPNFLILNTLRLCFPAFLPLTVCFSARYTHTRLLTHVNLLILSWLGLCLGGTHQAKKQPILTLFMATFLPYFVPFLPYFWHTLRFFSLFLNYFLSSYILDFQFVILAYARYSFPDDYN